MQFQKEKVKSAAVRHKLKLSLAYDVIMKAAIYHSSIIYYEAWI